MVDYIAITFLCRWWYVHLDFCGGKWSKLTCATTKGSSGTESNWSKHRRKSQRRKGGNRLICRTVKQCVLTSPMGMAWVPFFCIFRHVTGDVFFLNICKPCHLQTSLAWNVWLQFDSRILVFCATANFKDKILELWCTKIIANDYWSSLIQIPFCVCVDVSTHF